MFLHRSVRHPRLPAAFSAVQIRPASVVFHPTASNLCTRQAGEQSQWLDLVKNRVCLVTGLQEVVQHTRAQVMDMMEPDAAAEPAQHCRQPIE